MSLTSDAGYSRAETAGCAWWAAGKEDAGTWSGGALRELKGPRGGRPCTALVGGARGTPGREGASHAGARLQGCAGGEEPAVDVGDVSKGKTNVCTTRACACF